MNLLSKRRPSNTEFEEIYDVLGLKLKNMVSKYPKDVLKQLAKEDIPWISMFAGLQLKK